MPQNAASQVIQVPNMLRLKVGGKSGSLDNDVIARAEAALKSLSGQFAQWLQDEIDKLDAARSAIQAQGLNAATAEGLYLRAHDLKGLGSTYEFPLITRIAGSLCKLLDEPDKRAAAPLFLVDAHIHAIKAAVRDDIRDASHPVGKALAEELEGRVTQQLG
jgi:hypothetical protein